MNLRPLIIDDALKFEIDRIKCNAEAHHYIPGPGVGPPGDDHRFTFTTDFGYKFVFTLTESDDVLWRHFSISVPGRRLPNQIVTFTVAELFGFTGWDGVSDKPGADWMIKIEDPPYAVVMAQLVPARVLH